MKIIHIFSAEPNGYLIVDKIFSSFFTQVVLYIALPVVLVVLALALLAFVKGSPKKDSKKTLLIAVLLMVTAAILFLFGYLS